MTTSDKLSWLCFLTAVCVPATARAWAMEKSLTYLSATEEQQKLWHVINIILRLNPKQSTVLPSRRKINSIQAKTRSASNDVCVYEKVFSLTADLLLSLSHKEIPAVSFFISLTCPVLKYPKQPYSTIFDSIPTCQNSPCTANP